jgi:hypothetical protein
MDEKVIEVHINLRTFNVNELHRGIRVASGVETDIVGSGYFAFGVDFFDRSALRKLVELIIIITAKVSLLACDQGRRLDSHGHRLETLHVLLPKGLILQFKKFASKIFIVIRALLVEDLAHGLVRSAESASLWNGALTGLLFIRGKVSVLKSVSS